MTLDLSICILTRQAREILRDCLRSIPANTHRVTYEIIVVDNASSDGTREMLRDEFPRVRVIANDHNAGFTRASNQAIRASVGRYVLLLNNDTLILPDAFERLIAFADAHPAIGIVSPKVLNRDGTLQKQCRRSYATPWDLFCYFSGLATRYPQSRLFGRYLMTYMDENVTHAADAVSGSCMLIRRAVLDQIGLLDERFFAYQEDTDFCFRARQAGWHVYYFHQAEIIHFGGQGGSRVEPYRSIIEWHKSYFRYYRKNLARRYFFLFNWFYYLVMLLKLATALAVNFVRAEKFAGSKKP
ncbi:MAG: glycosyltransferase family 2 protein [Chloroflexi bacterium]|nr:glycosyltransferase family 2 protein [Chloroflexota bacterium]